MKIRSKSFALTLLVIILSFCFSCSRSQSTWKGSIEQVGGVTIVKNPIEPMYEVDVLELEEELAFGGGGSDESSMLSRPFSIQVDESGNIYILDVKEGHIKVFDPKGEFFKTIGRRGQGPGELNGPLSIRITPANELMVNCLTSSSLVYLSLDGEFLREDHMTKLPRSMIKIDSAGNFICHRPSGMGGEFKVLLEKYGADQEYQFLIAEQVPQRNKIYPPLEPGLIYGITPDNHIVWSITDQYVINITDPNGKLIRKIHQDYNPVVIVKEKLETAGSGFSPPGPEDVIPVHFPPIHGMISVDEDGRLFIKTYEKTGDGRGFIFDVFDREGRFLTKLGLGQIPRIPLLWKNHKLYSIEEDAEGFHVVKRYQATWKI